MVASIGAIASPAQGAGYFERDGYYTKDDPAHREASAWAGKGAEALGLSGPVDSGVFQAILEGRVPDGPHLGKRGKDGEIHHRPGRDVTMSAPKSVSLMAMIGGDERIVAAHDRAVKTTLGWIEKNAILTRMQDPGTSPGLSYEPGSATVGEAEWTVEALERDGRLHGAIGPEHGRHWATEAAVALEWETVGLMRAGKDAGERVMRRWVATTKLHRGRLNEGQKEAVRTVLSTKDRVVGVQGYAGTGKTAMLDRFRVLAESAGYRVAGLAPSASAARTLGQESGIRSETLQRFLARHAGFAEGRGTARSLRDMRKTHAKRILVVDESSLASSEQMRGLLRIAAALRLPRVVLVGDEKQLDGVEAGKPFAQLQRAGMTTATMDEILRQRDTELKEAVRASLAGEVKTAFAKLGDRVAQAEPDNLGQEAAKRWLSLSPEQRETAGVIAPTRALRDTINEAIRERLIAEGAVHGPAWETRKLVPRGLTNAEMTRTANYEAGDTVIFNRRYKTLGVDKGDAREVARVDAKTRTVHLKDDRGNIVEWKPVRIAAAKGGLEVYRSETTELRAGDRVRFTRNDPASGLTNGQVAEVETVEKDGVRFRLEDGSLTRLGESDPMLRHLDRAWAATVHAFQGRTVDRIVAAMPAGNAAPGEPEEPLRRDQPGARPGRSDHRRSETPRRSFAAGHG